MNPRQFLGEALRQRPDAKKKAKYQRTHGNAVSLEGVNVEVTTNKTQADFTSTDFPGDAFERMRRFGLVLAKYALPDSKKHADRWKSTEQSVNAASKIIAAHAYKALFDEDPTKDTVNTAPYILGFKADASNINMITSALSFSGTKAMTQIIEQVAKTNKAVAEMLNDCNNDIINWLKYRGDSTAEYLHAKNRHHVNYARSMYRELVDLIDNHANQIHRKAGKKPGKKPAPTKPPAPVTRKGRTTRELQNEKDLWETPFLVKHPLDIPHTGKAGRRLIAWNEGRTPKAFYRQVTDPQKRIFKRKTRALGGVVVFDCSGSMSLSEEDIRNVMKAAAGCSIVCYSASGDEDRDRRNGNIHLVARNGRQTRHLPDFPGGNGVDLPALMWAYDNLRLNSHSPVIWVSDGGVTGKGDVHNTTLLNHVKKYMKAKRITQVPNPEAAIKLLAKLQARRTK